MKSISTWFFATATVFALCGMIWGIQMSASHDYTFAPAHGHLNLIGFVAMSIFGTYYALTPEAAMSKVAMVHYWLVTITILMLIPGIFLAISEQKETLAIIGSILAVISMALFLFMVLRFGVGDQAKAEK
ncbi:hypothetical protein [Ahrensia marina]|uniref:Signal peptide protein n=1 Tax=Ahrensia marina TaxID=1514904 RepID=A0A0M9GKI2_9HYPH|nr:hypothetical protein [Ahrensia marina]KPA99862.1 signal peptide protein [Ahrensia marina]